eukprot:scaffold278_cov195-Amphora_coffeaeformis.AAC.8
MTFDTLHYIVEFHRILQIVEKGLLIASYGVNSVVYGMVEPGQTICGVKTVWQSTFSLVYQYQEASHPAQQEQQRNFLHSIVSNFAESAKSTHAIVVHIIMLKNVFIVPYNTMGTIP